MRMKQREQSQDSVNQQQNALGTEQGQVAEGSKKKSEKGSEWSERDIG